MSFLGLPVEVLSYVCSYLSFREALTMSSVCKYLYNSKPYDLPLLRILLKMAEKSTCGEKVILLLESGGNTEVERFFSSLSCQDKLTGLLKFLSTECFPEPPISFLSKVSRFLSSPDTKTISTLFVYNITRMCELLLLQDINMSQEQRDYTKKIIEKLLNTTLAYDNSQQRNSHNYRLTHLCWHAGLSICGSTLRVLQCELEEYIRLAILTDSPSAYFPLVVKRNNLSGNSGHEKRQEDVLEVIRCGSIRIFCRMKLPLTTEMRDLIYICEGREEPMKSRLLNVCSNCSTNVPYRCRVCHPVPSIEVMKQKLVDRLLS